MDMYPLEAATSTDFNLCAPIYESDSVCAALEIPVAEVEEYTRILRNYSPQLGNPLSFANFCNLFTRVSSRHHHLWFAYTLCESKIPVKQVESMLLSHLRRTLAVVKMESPGYCDTCDAFVVTCPHSLVGGLDFSKILTLYNTGGDYFRLEYAADVKWWPQGRSGFIMSLYGYHGKMPYWYAWKSYWWGSGHDNEQLRLALLWFSPIAIEGQNLVCEAQARGMLARVVSIFETIRGTILQLVGDLKDTVLSVFSSVIGSLLKSLSDSVDFASVFQNSFSKYLDDHCPKIVKEFPYGDLIKTCVRYWLGYKPVWIVTELMFSSSFVAFLMNWSKELAGAFSEAVTILDFDSLEGLDDSVMAQSPTLATVANLVVLMSTAFLCGPSVADGLNSDYVRKLLTNIALSGTAFQRAGVTQGIEQLMNYLSDDDPATRENIRLRQLYPRIFEFVDVYSTVDADILDSQKVALRQLYNEYLFCISHAARTDREALMQIASSARNYVERQGLTQPVRARKEPKFFLFCGTPGLGKSTLAYALARALSKAFARDANDTVVGKDCQTATYSAHDFFYSPGSTDKYCSGYTPTKCIWYFDDFLQKKDSTSDPSPGVKLVFDLITTSSFTVTMADLASKGMQGTCHSCVGATNAKISDAAWMAANIKSIQEPSAVRRRISHLIEPVIRAPYTYDGIAGRILNGKVPISSGLQIPFGQLYHFSVLDINNEQMMSPSGKMLWEWKEIVAEAYKYAISCRDYCAEDELDIELDYCVPSGRAFEYDFSCGEGSGSVEPQGFFDWVPYLRRVNCKCRANDELVPCICATQTVFNDSHYDIFTAEPIPQYVPWDRKRTRDFVIPPKGVRPTHFAKEEVTLREKQLCKVCGAYRLTCDCVEGNWYEDVVDGRQTYMTEMHPNVDGEDIPFHYKVTPVIEHKRVPTWLKNLGIGVCVMVLGVSSYRTAVALKRVCETHLVSGKSPLPVGEPGVQEIYDVNGTPVEAQGRYEITQNGRRYVLITYRNGDCRVYPQGGETIGAPKFVYDVHKSLFVNRVQDQLPHICSNLWAVVNLDGALVGNLLAIDSRRFVCPSHVAKILETSSFVLKKENESRPFSPGSSVVVTHHPSLDLALLEFVAATIDHKTFSHQRDILKYLCNEAPGTGEVCLFVRDASGAIIMKEGVFATPSNRLTYDSGGKTFTSYPSKTRSVPESSTVVGYCGGIYVTKGATQSHSILGYHVAARGSTAYFSLFDVWWLLSTPRKSGPDTLPSLVGTGPTGSIAEAVGFPTGKAISPYPLGKGRVKRFKNFRSNYVDANVAPLKAFINQSGELIYPPLVALAKLSSRRLVPEVDCTHLYGFVAALAKKFDRLEVKPKQGWNSYVAHGDLVSIDRSAVPGLPMALIGPKKMVGFEDSSEVQLTKDMVRLLDEAVGVLCPHDWATRDSREFSTLPATNVLSMKDESRPSEKAEVGATRPFQVTGLVDFILQRRFFYEFSHALMAKNLAYCSALGLAPENWEGIWEFVLKDATGVLAADFSYMDGSFTPEIIHLVGYFILCLYPNDGEEKRTVSPHLPPLNRDNFIRWVLLDRIANHRVSVQGAEFVPNRSHPSGSFLTTILNIGWQIIMWHFAFCAVSGRSLDEVMEKISCVFLGDDSLIATRGLECDPAALTDVAAKMNFTITSATKDAPLSWHRPWDPSGGKSEFMFLSRHLVKAAGNDVSGVIGLLTPDRMFKMLLFSNDAKHVKETYPQVVEAFIREFRWWIRFGHDNDVAAEGFRLLSRVTTLDLEEIMHADCDVIQTNVVKLMSSDPARFEFDDRFDDVPMVAEAQGNEHAVSYSKTEGKEEDACLASDEKAGDVALGTNAPVVIASAAPHDTKWVYSGMCKDSTNLDKFAKPVQVAIATANSNPGDHKFWSSNFPSGYFIANPIARSKLVNYAFLRCTMCVRLVLASTPSISGKFIFSARYGVSETGTVYEAISNISIEVDASAGTAAVLKLPTVLPHSWSLIEEYNNNRSKFDFVNVSVWSLTPISGILPFTVYAWLEEVDLRMPMYMEPLIAQVRGPDTVREMASDVFATARKGIRTFSGVVADVASIIDTAAKFAALVGLSMPAKSDPGSLMSSSIPCPNFPHAVGPVLSSRMALVQEQKTVQPQGTWGCEGDDMDIRNVCSRPGILGVGNYTEAGFVTSWEVNPGVHLKIATKRYMSHLAYVALGFQYWRGTIKYRIALAKTAFHAGQLEVIYQPGRNYIPITSTSEAAFNHRWTWDITQSASFEFSVPYSSALPWAAVHMENTSGIPASPIFNPSALTGMISIIAATAPSVMADSAGTSLVSSSIPYVIYTWSEDIEFAVHCLSIGDPQAVPQVGPWSDSSPEGILCAAPVSLYDANPVSVVTNASCIGEAIPNLRMLTRKLHHQQIPYDNYVTLGDLLKVTYMEWMSRIYLFCSGGVRASWMVYTVGANPSSPLYAQVTRWYQVMKPIAEQRYIVHMGIPIMADLPWQYPVPFMYIEDVKSSTQMDCLDVNVFAGPGSITLADSAWETYLSGADDFTYGFLVAPPEFTDEIWSSQDFEYRQGPTVAAGENPRVPLPRTRPRRPPPPG